MHFTEKWEKYNTASFCIVSLKKSFQKLVLQVSSGFQRLENNKTTWPVALWFQMFSRVWKPVETLALVFDIVLRAQREILKFHRQPSWIFFQRVLGQNFKFVYGQIGPRNDV